MRILVICDDQWHPARIVRAGLGALPEGEFQFDWLEDATEWPGLNLAGYPLVVLTKSNNISSTNHDPWMTEPIQAAFLGFVRQGGGLLAIHSGTVGYQDTPVLRGLLGGVFVHHPPQCPVEVTPRPGHPLTAGCAAFTLKDEHYFMALDDAQAPVFLTSASEHGEQPAGWTRAEGRGRVGVLTPGHNVEVWLHPSYQAILGNMMRWASVKT